MRERITVPEYREKEKNIISNEMYDDITEFTGRYYFLSNYYEYPLVYNGIEYSSAEAAFQCQKNPDELIEKYHLAPPNVAKAAGRACQLRPFWDDVKDQIMEDIIRAKFSQKYLAVKLLATVNSPNLIEGNDWGDSYWGVDKKTGYGENKLGQILVKIRDELEDGGIV